MLIDKVEEQDIRIKKLEYQLNKNSRNSRKPPSTDSPFKNKDKKKKTQNPGTKKKRKGSTLNQFFDLDKIILCKVEFYEHCHKVNRAVFPEGVTHNRSSNYDSKVFIVV